MCGDVEGSFGDAGFTLNLVAEFECGLESDGFEGGVELGHLTEGFIGFGVYFGGWGDDTGIEGGGDEESKGEGFEDGGHGVKLQKGRWLEVLYHRLWWERWCDEYVKGMLLGGGNCSMMCGCSSRGVMGDESSRELEGADWLAS